MSGMPAASDAVTVKKRLTLLRPERASLAFGIGVLAISLAVWWMMHGVYQFPLSISQKFHFDVWINNGEAWLEGNVKWMTRAIAAQIGAMLDVIETFLWLAPWPAVVTTLTLAALAFGGLRLAIFTALGTLFWGAMDMWDAAMSTMALMSASVLFSVVIGVAVGVLCSQSDRLEAFARPILDTMQTMPSFVYLIPAIFFFGIGGPSATMAIIVYAIPPAVRLTNLGIRQVSANTIEAATSFGSTRRQTLFKVQLPLALPSIMIGINQTIMMALGLAVLATFIGAGGLGDEVWNALKKLKVGWSLEGGLSIVFMAIIFDRLSLAMSRQGRSNTVVDPSRMVFRLLPQKWVNNQAARGVEQVIDALWRAVGTVGRTVALGVGSGLSAACRPFMGHASQSIYDWVKLHAFFVASALLIAAIFAWNAWIGSIPSYPRAWQFTLRGPVDDLVAWLAVEPGFIAFTKGTRAIIYLYFLNPLEKFLVGLPWWYVLAAAFVMCWRSVGIGFAIITLISLFFTGAAGLWDITMYTLAATIASVVISLVIGVPLGIAAAYSRALDAVLQPVLDAMQTMPAFVYLIPVLMFFGGNPVTAVIATVIYALPPVIRMTVLGLRQLPEEIDEVTRAFGSTPMQSLIKVRLPMASPSIMLGVNQAVVMALAMQVITPLVAGLGLGKEVFHAMSTANTGQGLVAGIGIVLLAILLDRLTQAWTRNQRKALGL